MAGFVLRRIAGAAAVAVAVSALTFVTLHGLAPEDFADTRPLPAELWHYLVGVFVHADLGTSQCFPRRPVLALLGEALPADVSLLAGGMAAACCSA